MVVVVVAAVVVQVAVAVVGAVVTLSFVSSYSTILDRSSTVV